DDDDMVRALTIDFGEIDPEQFTVVIKDFPHPLLLVRVDVAEQRLASRVVAVVDTVANRESSGRDRTAARGEVVLVLGIAVPGLVVCARIIKGQTRSSDRLALDEQRRATIEGA